MDQTQIQLDEEQQNDNTMDTSVIMKQKLVATAHEKLKNPESQHLKGKILSFIRDVQQNKFSSEKLPQLIVDKIQEVEEEFQNIWNEPEEIMNENGEIFENIITKPIYSQLIQLFDNQRDHNLEFAFRIFEFVQPKHLEIDEQIINNPKFENVIQCINKIDSEQTPRNKLACIMNASIQISTIVNSLSSNRTPTGADNFLPVLIYAVLKAKPNNPNSNVEYIGNFRSYKRIQGQEEYYFTSYQSALEFIEFIDHNKLSMDPEEFKRNCSKRVQGIKYEEYQPEENHFQFDAYQNYVNLQMMRMKIQEVQKTARFYNSQKKHKLKFSNRGLNDINLSEIPEFCMEYQSLLKNHLEIQKQLDNLQKHNDQMIREIVHQKNKQKQGKRFFGLI